MKVRFQEIQHIHTFFYRHTQVVQALSWSSFLEVLSAQTDIDWTVWLDGISIISCLLSMSASAFSCRIPLWPKSANKKRAALHLLVGWLHQSCTTDYYVDTVALKVY